MDSNLLNDDFSGVIAKTTETPGVSPVPAKKDNRTVKMITEHGEMPLDLAKKMIAGYHDHHAKIAAHLPEDADIKVDDTRWIWFPKAVIDNLFAKNGCNEFNNHEYGVRLYYGKVPAEATDHGVAEENVGRHNVVMVATRRNPKGHNADLLMTAEEADPGIGTGGQAVDNGSTCPPNCDEGSSL